MTINVAVVTAEAIVLGCDSISSSSELVHFDPFSSFDRDEKGEMVVDQNGNWIARINPDSLRYVVTWARSGVTKMFPLCGDHNPVAATTAGLAALNGKNIANLVLEFRRAYPCEEYSTVRDVVSDFTNFMSQQYEQHFDGDAIPAVYRPDIEFLIGGYGSGENFPSLYRVNLKDPIESRLKPVHGHEQEFPMRHGLAWSGQADAVERLVFGYDQRLRYGVQMAVRRHLRRSHREFSERLVETLQMICNQQGIPIPDNLDIDLPLPDEVELPWDTQQIYIDAANIPLQDAIDLASYLVNLQSGKATFSDGVPTVGGRTHIGVVSRSGFKMLNEPDLIHRNTGYDRSI